MVKSSATLINIQLFQEDARMLSSTGEATLVIEVIVGSELQPNCREGDQK